MGLGAALGLGLNWAGGRGLVDASLVGNVAMVGKEIGDLFLRLLQMLVVPLIISSLITGITGMGDLRTLGSIGGRAVGFYLTALWVLGLFEDVRFLADPARDREGLIREASERNRIARPKGSVSRDF